VHYYDEKRRRMPKKHDLNIAKRKRVCVHGHFSNARGFGVMDYYPDADQFITVLRDPFEVCLSHYFYLCKMGKALVWDWRVSTMKKMFVRHVMGKELYRDGNALQMVLPLEEYLAKHSSFILNFMPFEMNMDNYEEILDRYFVHIGVAEDLQTSVDVLASRLGFKTVKIAKLNVSERMAEVPDSVRKKFIEAHPLEYAIYKYALETYKS